MPKLLVFKINGDKMVTLQMVPYKQVRQIKIHQISVKSEDRLWYVRPYLYFQVKSCLSPYHQLTTLTKAGKFVYEVLKCAQFLNLNFDYEDQSKIQNNKSNRSINIMISLSAY